MQLDTPIWIVCFGSTNSIYYTFYHADQMMRALRLNGTACHCIKRYALDFNRATTEKK